MDLTRINPKASDTLHTARYLARFTDTSLRSKARMAIRMPSYQGGFACAAADVYRLAEICALDADPLSGEVLEEVMEFRTRAFVHALTRVKNLGEKLYPFQEDGVRFLSTNRDTLLFDEMGLGKTVQALVALPDDAYGVVVAPKSLTLAWCKDAERWRPDLTFIPADRTALRAVKPGEFLVTTPDAIRIHHEQRPITNPNEVKVGSVVILDEAHYYKTPDAARTIAICRLIEHYDIRWALTGTPLANRPPDLWGTLSSIGLATKMFGGKKNFMRIFGGRKLEHDQIVWAKEPPHPKDLALAFRGRALRRLRKVVAPEIPEKTYSTIQCTAPICSPDDRAAIARAARAMETGDPMSDRKLGELSKLRADLARSKVSTMLAFVAQFVDSATPLVVVCANSDPLTALNMAYDCPLIVGSTNAMDRFQAVSEFQDGRVKLIGFHPQAGGVGITLTAAHHLLFVQRDWSVAVNSQAEDRICRIGQRETCVIYDIVSNHPLDTRIFNALRSKSTLMNSTMEAVPS